MKRARPMIRTILPRAPRWSAWLLTLFVPLAAACDGDDSSEELDEEDDAALVDELEAAPSAAPSAASSGAPTEVAPAFKQGNDH